MKRAVPLLLSAALLLGLLTACQEAAPSGSSSVLETGWTAANLSEIAFQLSGLEESDEFEHLYIDHDRERLAAYIENAYGLEGWEDAAVSRAVGASAFEIAVLRMADSDAAVQAASALMSYIFSRQEDFAGYAPAEADMVANGSILQDGPVHLPGPGGGICRGGSRAQRRPSPGGAGARQRSSPGGAGEDHRGRKGDAGLPGV